MTLRTAGYELPRLDDPSFYDLPLDDVRAAFAQLRERQPVYWYEPGGFWVLSKYEDQRHVSSHPEIFSSRFGILIGDTFDAESVADQLPEWAQEQLRAGDLTPAQTRGLIARAKLSGGDPDFLNMIVTDPPLHSEMRRVFTRALSQRVIRGLGAHVQRLTDEALDTIEPGSTVEFVEALAARVPANLMADLIGVPQADQENFILWSQSFLEAASITPETDPERVARLQEHIAAFMEYLGDLVDKRRAEPGDDVLSRMLTSEIGGKPLSRITAMSYAQLIITGGSDTSRHLIAFLALALAEHPSERERLLAQPNLIAGAVDETLRWYPVVWSECRTALERTEIRGTTIEKDDYVVMPFLSGNCDEDTWERPHEFDVSRRFDAEHLAFGWGQHYCPGASLARLEGCVVLERILARFPEWEVVGEPERFTSPFMNGLTSLQVRFSGGGKL